jgi:protein phosphatase
VRHHRPVSIDLAIPDPCLVVLIGAAGSGKSTFAARHFAPSEILSSDDFRARLGHGEADQAASRRAFGVLHAALERRLAVGRTSVVDATNVQAHARQALIRRATSAGVQTLAIVFELPLAECLAGDRARSDRHVPEAIVERQWTELRSTLDGAPLTTEGFAAVQRLTSRAAADSVVLRRGGEGWPTLSPAAPPGRRG